MPHPTTGRCLGPAGLALLLAWACPAGAGVAWAEGKSLTSEELVALQREHPMWRLVRPDEEVSANLGRLVRAGFPVKAVAELKPRLVAWWDVPVERNFGWLRYETIEQIQEIDERFVVRVRAARLFEGTGVFKGEGKPVSVTSVLAQWRAAIFQVLNFDEFAEFRLMNSAAARQLAQLVKDLPVSDDELRTLFQWQRDYEGRRGASTAVTATPPVWERQAQLDEWERIRDLLGDQRFAVYLGRASPAFARMRAAVDKPAPAEPKVVLDLWWLRQKYEMARSEEPRQREKEALALELRTRAAGLLGEARFAAYAESDEARWMFPPIVAMPAAVAVAKINAP